MRGKEDAGLGGAVCGGMGGEAADDVGAAGFDLLQNGLCAGGGEEVGDVACAGFFADAWRTGVAVGIDGGDADESLGEFDDVRGEGGHEAERHRP